MKGPEEAGAEMVTGVDNSGNAAWITSASVPVLYLVVTGIGGASSLSPERGV
jgi:hypothetical protein